MNISLSLIISYSLYSFFLFNQQLHLKNFQGASRAFAAVLGIFVFVGMIFGHGFLLYYGYKVSWLQAGALFLLAFLIKIAWFFIEAKTGLRNFAWVFSAGGFVALPGCGYFMWAALP